MRPINDKNAHSLFSVVSLLLRDDSPLFMVDFSIQNVETFSASGVDRDFVV